VPERYKVFRDGQQLGTVQADSIKEAADLADAAFPKPPEIPQEAKRVGTKEGNEVVKG